MKNFDWMLQVVWQVLTNQSALFQSSYSTVKMYVFNDQTKDVYDNCAAIIFCSFHRLKVYVLQY